MVVPGVSLGVQELISEFPGVVFFFFGDMIVW
jgi:hypothetical protein